MNGDGGGHGLLGPQLLRQCTVAAANLPGGAGGNPPCSPGSLKQSHGWITMTGQYAHRVVKVTVSGTMLNGSEEWQTGWHMGYLTQDASAPTQAFVDLVRDQWILHIHNNADVPVNNTFKFTEAKAALIHTDGKYTSNDDVVVSHPAGVVSGARAGAPLPPQVALVATLIGGSGKGIGGKGRMYLPGISQEIDGNGRILPLICQNVANQLAAMFNTLDGFAGAPGHVVNASKGSKRTLYTDGRNVPVNGIRVGNVYDTQRRRRNSLQETYSTAVVTD